MPPKKPTATGAKKPATKPTTNATTPPNSAKGAPKAPVDRNSLVTAHTSPVIVKKAFQKLIKLFKALIDDMEEPLNPKIKAQILDKAGFDQLAKKLSHAITKYVLFVCQEGTISTIESQTQILLNSIRTMTLAIRARLKDAGLTLQISLASTGSDILESMILLMEDLSDQVSVEWKQCLDANGSFQSPLNADGSQIVQITARVWSACEKLATMPLTDQDAITLQGMNYLSMIKDATTEFKAIQEGDHEFPIEEEEEEEEQDEDEESTPTEATGQDKAPKSPQPEDITVPQLISAEETPPAQSPTESATTTTASTQDIKNDGEIEAAADTHTISTNFKDHDFSQNIVSKAEYSWVQHCRDILTFASNLISTFFSKILPALQHPATVGTVVDLKQPGSLNQQKQFTISLERRLADIEKMVYYADLMCTELYSPQNIPKASKYAWFIVSKLSRLLTWCEIYYKQLWLKNVMDTPAGGIIFLSEKEESLAPSVQTFSLREYNKLMAHHTWWIDMLINPTLRPIVIGKDNQYISNTKVCPQNNRLHEFDTASKDFKLTPISTWKFINFQRKELFELIYAKKYRDNNNLILTHFKLKSYSFPLPPQDVTDPALIPASTGEFVLPPHIFTENDLFDDKEDVEPDSDDEEEDYDEDIDLYDDDFGFYSD